MRLARGDLNRGFADTWGNGHADRAEGGGGTGLDRRTQQVCFFAIDDFDFFKRVQVPPNVAPLMGKPAGLKPRVECEVPAGLRSCVFGNFGFGRAVSVRIRRCVAGVKGRGWSGAG